MSTDPKLETRPLRLDDASFVYQLYSDPRVYGTLAHPDPFSRERARAFCTASPADTGQWRFAALDRSSGERVGVGGVRDHLAERGFATIGYAITPSRWNQGLATALARLLADFSFERLRAPEARASTLASNGASRRVLEKLGFRLIEELDEPDRQGGRRRLLRFALQAEQRGNQLLSV